MTKRVGDLDVPVTEVELENGVSAGINLLSLGNGLVTIWEEHAARKETSYSLDKWYELDPMERAFVVAQYRVANAMRNLQAEAEIKKSRQDARKGMK